jgi:hypothetical protein
LSFIPRTSGTATLDPAAVAVVGGASVVVVVLVVVVDIRTTARGAGALPQAARTQAAATRAVPATAG